MSGSQYRSLPPELVTSNAQLFGASYLQDSGMARSMEEGFQVLQRFGRMGPAVVEGYSPFADPELRGFLAENPDSMRMFAESRGPEHSQFIADRVRQMKEREHLLTMGGAFWTRMAAGMLSPEVVASFPFGIGELTAATRLGRAGQAAGRMAGLNAGATAAEWASERGQLPDSIAPDLLPDVALSAIFGLALGGVAGAVSGRMVDRAAARHAAVHDAADGQRTPGVAPAEIEALRPAARATAEAWPAGARLSEEGAVAAATVVRRILGDRAVVDVGELPPGTEGAALGHVVRFAWGLSDEAAPTVARHESIHGLRSMQLISDQEWQLLEATARREGWEAKHQVEERWAEFGLTPEKKLEEAIAEQFATWAKGQEEPTGPLAQLWAKLKEFFEQLRNGLQGLGFDSAERIFARAEAGEMAGRPAPRTAEAPELRALIEQQMDRWASLHLETSEFADASVPASPVAGSAGRGDPPPGTVLPSPSAAALPPAADSQRLASAFGLEKLHWSQMPYYLLKNNRFTGAAGEAVARLASEIVQDPGLRMQGPNSAASIEALTKQYGARLADVTGEMDRLYYQHAGFDPAAATPGRVKLEEIKQQLPGVGGAPEGKLSMAAFEEQVFRAVAEGGKHEIPEVAQAAGIWRDRFFTPFQREAAEAGVTLDGAFKAESAAAVQREIDGATLRIAELERRLDPKNTALPAEVRERFNLVLEQQQGALAQAKERLTAAAERPAMREPYVFHNWLRNKVAEQRDELEDKLAKHWNGERPHGSWAPGLVRAAIAVSHLLRESVPETLERALARHFHLGGLDMQSATLRAQATAAPVRQMVEAMMPDRLGVEIRSALAWRQEQGPIKGLAAEVKKALDEAGLRGSTKERDEFLLRQIVGREEASAPGDFADRARPGHAKEREIDVPTRLIADFLDTDMKTMGADYARRMGAAIETGRKMGDPSMLGRLAALEIQLLDEVAAGRGTLAEVDLSLQAARDLRDKVLGTFRIPEDPSAYSVRTLRFLTNSAILSQMGSALFANITDLGRVVMAHGITNVLGGAMDLALHNRAAWKLGGDEARKAGAALELTNLARQRELQDLRDVSADASLAERVADKGAKAMQLVNLVGVWTEKMQRFSGAMHQSEMIELAVEAAAGRLTTEQRLRMHGYGIDDAQAGRIANAWQAAGAQRGGRLFLADTDSWADADLVRSFRAQLATAVDSSVMKPGAADRPNFMSAPLWQTTLLYKGFAMAASQRLVLAGLQQRDGRVLSGILASVSIAWLINQARDAAPAETAVNWDAVYGRDTKRGREGALVPMDSLFNAIERAGVLGIMGDMNNALETVSGNSLGLRSMLGLQPQIFNRDPNWAQKVATVTGAATSPILGAIWATTSPQATGDQMAGAFRRMMPGQNLIWLEGTMRALSREAGGAMGGDQ